MSLKRLSSALALAGLLCAQSPIDAMLSQYEAQLKQGKPSATQVQNNLTALNSGLQHANWSNPDQRINATSRSLNYLNSVSGYGAGNRGIGLALSGAYRHLGGLQSNPQSAWLNYRSAFLMLNQYPMDNQIRSEMQTLRRSVEQVEAKLPELPRLDWSSLDTGLQKEYDSTMERYISVAAAVTSAEVTAETMRRNMADQGLAIRPDVIGGLTRMKLKLEDARRLIEQRNFSTAKERLGSAEGEAQKILKSFGG